MDGNKTNNITGTITTKITTTIMTNITSNVTSNITTIMTNITSNVTSNITNGTSPGQAPAPPGQSVAVQTALCVIAVLALFGNGLVVYFVATRRRLRTKTNFMVVSLAVSDLFVGMAIIPSYIACNYVKCDFILSKLFYDAFLFVSVCNLCCITFDRFMAVTRPLRYHMMMTRRKVIVMVIMSWVVPSLVSITPVAWLYTDTGQEAVTRDNKIFYTIQVVVFMFFPCLIMLVAYAVIFNIAWKQTRHIRHVLKSLRNTNGAASRPIPTASTREAKATLKVFGTVVVVFVVCWILSAFRSIVIYYSLAVTLNDDLTQTSRLLLVGNSAINPIIYALWKKDIKMEIRKLLKLNSQMVRPSSGTFRSSQDFRFDSTNDSHSLERKPSCVGSTRDITLTPAKLGNRPLNGIVNEPASVENVETDIKLEAEDQPTPKLTPETLEFGRVNTVVEVDGLV